MEIRKSVLLWVGCVAGALADEEYRSKLSGAGFEQIDIVPTRVADSVAKRIGIDQVAAEVLPADKASAVKRFQAGGKRVAMVGDGVNDAPALATADVGIAIGAGTDVAIESAGIVLVRSDPRDVVGAIELSRATYRKMIQNLVWATAYNLVAIPVAAGVFIHWGFDLPMSVGAVAMSLSTIIVAANAQLLRRLKLQRGAV
jgi:P-type Cu2+ transporter